MGESEIYDTSAIVELARRRITRRAPYILIITVVEYLSAVGYAESIIYPTWRGYNLAIVWQSRLRALGSPLPATDLVIATQAVNNNMVLVTKDKHFKILKETVAGDLQLEVLGWWRACRVDLKAMVELRACCMPGLGLGFIRVKALSVLRCFGFG